LCFDESSGTETQKKLTDNREVVFNRKKMNEKHMMYKLNIAQENLDELASIRQQYYKGNGADDQQAATQRLYQFLQDRGCEHIWHDFAMFPMEQVAEKIDTGLKNHLETEATMRHLQDHHLQ
jgi:hypothetical protein